jgi:hypothetical protein
VAGAELDELALAGRRDVVESVARRRRLGERLVEGLSTT